MALERGAASGAGRSTGTGRTALWIAGFRSIQRGGLLCFASGVRLYDWDKRMRHAGDVLAGCGLRGARTTNGLDGGVGMLQTVTNLLAGWLVYAAL